MTAITPESWATDLLTRMGYPVTSNNLTSVLAWEYQEGGHFSNAATFNPLNSTLAHGTYGSMNSVGVATYPDYETGMKETIKTLNEHYYDKVRADLQAGADPSTTTADIKASPWGTWHGGASTTAALGRARATVAAHPASAGTPAAAPAAAPTSATPTPAAVAPAAAALAVPAASAAASAAPSASGSTASGSAGFTGADVDGLDRLSREFTQAAQICTEVKTVCEAIVAAASFFGPFGAAFVAYLKGTVIPWLQKIAEALTAMATLLSQHSQAQKDASSSATSLPSYSGPTNLPQTSTQAYPTIGQVVTGTLVGAALGPVASATAAVALIGAVAGANGATADSGAKAGETPERVAPHTAEVSRNLGAIMNRESVQSFEEETLGVKGGSPVHPTATIVSTDGDVAVLRSTGENVDVSILQAKGGAALFGGYDPKDGYQLGGAASGSLNAADVKLHADVPLGGVGTLKLADETSLGASAQAQAIGAYNPITHTATATAGGEVFAGLRTTATVQEVTPYFTNTTELTGQLGAGAAADAGVVLSPGHLSVHGGVGAAIGLGAKVSDNLDIDYQRIATDAYTGASTVVTGVGTEIDAVGRTVGGYLFPTPPPAR